MKIDIVNYKSEKTSEMDIANFVGDTVVRDDLIQEVIRWQNSNSRSGCHKTKQRSEVSGSTKKLFRQKGRGAARHGSAKAPIFVGGGVAFGPVVRSHSYKLNKKVRSKALKSALNLAYANKSLSALSLDSLPGKDNQPKLSLFKKVIKFYNNKKVLFIYSDSDQESIFRKSLSNVKNFNFLNVNGVNVRDIMMNNQVVFLLPAAKKFFEKEV